MERLLFSVFVLHIINQHFLEGSKTGDIDNSEGIANLKENQKKEDDQR